MGEPVPSLEETLRPFDQATEPFAERDVHSALDQLRKKEMAAGMGYPPDSVAECAAFMFCRGYRWKEEGWGTYYGPMFGGTDKQGNLVYTPDIKQFNEDTLAYWGKRAREAQHPVLRIRYADLCWDFAAKVTGKRPCIELAHILVDSTLDVITRRLFKHPVDGREKLVRALSVTLSIQDQNRIGDLRDAIIAYEDAVAQDDKPAVWGFSFDLLLENKKINVSEGQRAKIINDLEGRLSRLSKAEEGSLPDHWSAEAAAVRLARHYRRLNKLEDMKRVLYLYVQAVRVASEKPNAMVATAWLRRAYDVLRQFGLEEEAEVVARRMREVDQKVPEQLAKLDQKIEIPKEEFEAVINQMTAGGLEHALNQIAVAFLPRKDHITKSVQAIKQNAVMMAIMPFTIVDHKGRPVAAVGSVDDDLSGRIVFHMSQHFQIDGIWLEGSLNRVAELYHPTVGEYLSFIMVAPVFPAEKQPLLEAGLKAYLADDMMVAAHLLIPQVEDAVRNLVELTGGTIYRPHRNGGFVLKNLDELLREPGFMHVLGEDVVLYFRVLYTDQRGWNLRNNVCHGIEPAQAFGRGMVNRIIHSLLILGTLRARPAEIPPQSEPPYSGPLNDTATS